MSEHLTPLTGYSTLPKTPKVPIAIEEEVVCEEEALEAMRGAGCIDLSANAISNLRKVGVHIHAQGTIRLTRGRAIITQHRLDSLMKILHEEVTELHQDKNRKDRLKAMLAIAQTIGYLSSRQTSSMALLVLLEGGKQNIDASGIADDVVQSFVQGQDVKPANHTVIMAREVHMNPSPNPR